MRNSDRSRLMFLGLCFVTAILVVLGASRLAAHDTAAGTSGRTAAGHVLLSAVDPARGESYEVGAATWRSFMHLDGSPPPTAGRLAYTLVRGAQVAAAPAGGEKNTLSGEESSRRRGRTAG